MLWLGSVPHLRAQRGLDPAELTAPGSVFPWEPALGVVPLIHCPSCDWVLSCLTWLFVLLCFRGMAGVLR